MGAPTARLPAAQRREQLLDLCARVVDVEGFHAATLDRVAAEAGVSRTVLYQHFGGLDGLFDAVVERATARAAHALTDATGDWADDSPVAAMASILTAVDADPATWRLFLVLPPSGPASLAAALERGRAAIRRAVAVSLADAGPADPELAARLLQAVADELVRLRLADPAVWTHERLLRQYEALVGPLIGGRARGGARR